MRVSDAYVICLRQGVVVTHIHLISVWVTVGSRRQIAHPKILSHVAAGIYAEAARIQVEGAKRPRNERGVFIDVAVAGIAALDIGVCELDFAPLSNRDLAWRITPQD